MRDWKRTTVASLIIACVAVALVACSAIASPTATTAPPSPTASAALPHSMKGYELYSWQANGAWHFALLTGTNRVKSLEEITAPGETVTADGWVHIHVQGVAALKSLLSRVPANEWVLWSGVGWLEQVQTDAVDLALPPQETVDDVVNYCKPLGLELHVSQ